MPMLKNTLSKLSKAFKKAKMPQSAPMDVPSAIPGAELSLVDAPLPTHQEAKPSKVKVRYHSLYQPSIDIKRHSSAPSRSWAWRRTRPIYPSKPPRNPLAPSWRVSSASQRGRKRLKLSHMSCKNPKMISRPNRWWRDHPPLCSTSEYQSEVRWWSSVLLLLTSLQSSTGLRSARPRFNCPARPLSSIFSNKNNNNIIFIILYLLCSF